MRKGKCLIKWHRRGAEGRVRRQGSRKQTSKGLVFGGNEFRFYLERIELHSKILNKGVT